MYTPISDEENLSLTAGDSVLISGIICTARDAVHKWWMDYFIKNDEKPSLDDEQIFRKMETYLKDGVLYHCGPIVIQEDNKEYRVIAAGPTTSIREEPYEAEVMRLFNIKAIIGKGGMGEKTLRACCEIPAVYMHAVGGAAVYLAKAVKKVVGVYKLEFGVPEAIWLLEVENFPAVVTMDSHGNSLHTLIESISRKELEKLYMM